MSLLSRLLALTFVSVLPAIAVLLYNEYDLRTAREAHLREQAMQSARATADELDRIVEGARDLLVTIADAPLVRTMDWPGCNRYLADLADSYTSYARLAVADRTGRIVCANTPAQYEPSLVDRPHFQEAFTRREFTVGRYIVGRRSGVTLLPFAAPFQDQDGRIGGVVVIGLKLDWLAQTMARKVLPPDGTILIADRDGTILARSPNPDQWVGQPIGEDMRASFEAGGPGTTVSVGLDGIRRVYGYIPPGVPPAGLYITAGIGTAQALREIDATFERGLVLVALAGLAALIATWFLGDRFIRQPIRRLIAGANDLGLGRYQETPSADGSTEFGSLNRALVDAAQKLAAREAALRASEARFQRLASLTEEGLAIHDGERIVEANIAAARLFGYAHAHEVIGRPAIEFIAPEIRAEAEASIRASREAPYESIGLRKDGSRFPIELYGRRIEYDGRIMRVIGIRDLTYHKKAEEALRQAEERYRLAVRATNDVIWDRDIEKNRVTFNEAICTTFGYEPGEVRSTPEWWSDKIHPDDRTRILSGIRAITSGTGQSWSDEYRFRRADGTWADVLDRALIVRDRDGKAVRVIGSMLDLTQRKRVEAALQNAVERNRALLREANHRIKNNLQLVSSLLGLQRGTLDDPEARLALEDARRRIRAIARVHEGFYSTGLFDCADFGDVLRSLRESMATDRENQPDIVVDVPPGWFVASDKATPLALIANELLTNALKHAFLPGQRGIITVRCSAAPDGAMILAVSDNGRGPPPGFNLSTPSGLGFGLRLVQTLGRQIGAKIEIHTAEAGMTIEIRVPHTPQNAEPSLTESPARSGEVAR